MQGISHFIHFNNKRILSFSFQTEFTAMREQYMRNGEGFILCFSITDRQSFEELAAYRTLINRVRASEDIPIIIAGNKCDLEQKRKVRLCNTPHL